jgi:hypothetical protein
MLTGKHAEKTEMHRLWFEQKESEWCIYLEGRDKPIGRIFHQANGEWWGEMSLDGRRAARPGTTPQAIIDDFQSWIAADMPPRHVIL